MIRSVWSNGVYVTALLTIACWLASQPPSSFGDSRDEYISAANWMSFEYHLGDSIIDRMPSLESLEGLAKNSNEPAVKRACELVLIGLTAERANRGSGERAIAKARQQVDETARAAERGEFTRKEAYYDYDSKGNLRRTDVEVNDSFGPVAGSIALWSLTQEIAPEQEILRRRMAMDGSRMRAWDELLPALAERLAGPLDREPLVGIEYRTDNHGGRPWPDPRQSLIPGAPSSADRFRGRYLAHNRSDRELHNVTIAVEMFHYSTLPEPTLRQVYFLPRWERGGAFELSRSFLLDLKRGGGKYKVQIFDKGPSGAPESSPELDSMAGIVKMRTTVWADEARQEPLAVDLSQRAGIVAGVLVKQAERYVASNYAVPSANKRQVSELQAKISADMRAAAKARGDDRPQLAPEEAAKRNTQMLLEGLLRPVLAFLPADADSAKQARRLLANYQAVRVELLKQRDNALLDACGPGQRFVGTCSGPSRKGPMALLFVSRDAQGRQIKAEVYDPDHPEKRRLVVGSLAQDRKTGSTMIVLQPAANRLHQLGPRSALLGFEVFSDDILTYRFKLEDTQLVGHASTNAPEMAAYDPDSIPIFLQASSPDDEELALAKERDRSQPPSPAPKQSAAVKGQRPLPAAGKSKLPGKNQTRPTSPPFAPPGRRPMPNPR